MFKFIPTLIAFGATVVGDVFALDFPINLELPDDGTLGTTFGDGTIEQLLDPYGELDFTHPEDQAWKNDLQYTDDFTVNLRRRAQVALEVPFKEVDFETHYDEYGNVDYYPIYQFDNGTTVLVEPGYLLLENGHLVAQSDAGSYYAQNGENVGQSDDPALLEGRTFWHEERTVWNAPLHGTPAACECRGLQVMLRGQCVATIEHAVLNSIAGDVIVLANNNSISKPIYVGHDLAFVGQDCPGYGKATLFMNYHDKYKAGLMLANRESQTLHVNNIDAFGGKDRTRAQQNFNSFAQAVDFYAWISLQVVNSKFRDFFSAHRGAVFFAWTTGNITIDSQSEFMYNTVAERREVFGGGGALSLGYIAEDSYVNINGKFHNNAVVYPYPFGSEHGEGGAIFAEYSTGHVFIGGEFKNNFAADGGAVHIKNLHNGSLTVDGHFEHNMALDTGAGCRGGALRVLNMTAPFVIRGTYVDNLADTGRGAVLALNILMRTSSVTLDGEFRLNTCGNQGAVVSQTSAFFGEIVYKKGTKMVGNVAHGNWKSDIMYIKRPVTQRLKHADLDLDEYGAIEEDLRYVMIRP